ncbi:phosphoglycerate dehydrogenase [Amedibacillus sp. YH-ame6]
MLGKILVTPRAFAKSGMQQIENLRKSGWDVHVNETGKSYTREEFLELAKDVDGIIIGVDIADKEMLNSCKNLKAIAKYGVGVDNIDMKVAKKNGIKVSRTIGSNSVSVAEHAMGLLFSIAKNVCAANAEVKNGEWNKNYGFELNNKTLGIIGFGNIGKLIAKMAQGMNMKIMAHDVFPIDEAYAKEHNIQIASFEELICSSDAITVHLPLTEDTKDLINKDVFEKMKKSAVLINAARGGIVNEEDLYDALKNKTIAAAGFDVFSSEPPKKGEILLTLDNFILTPHTASKTKEADANTIQMSVDNILKDLGGSTYEK